MARQVCGLVLLALCAACAQEEHTTVVADRTLPVVVRPSDSELLTEARLACEHYGLLRGSATFDRCVRNEFAARRPG